MCGRQKYHPDHWWYRTVMEGLRVAGMRLWVPFVGDVRKDCTYK